MTQTQRFFGGARYAPLALSVAFLLTVTGCGGSGSKGRQPAVNSSSRANPLSSMFRITVFAKTPSNPTGAYQCYLAQRPGQRDEGLSFVSDLELASAPGQPGRGMVFVYPDNRTLAFTGRNTLINLDVVYAVGVGRGVGQVVDITTIDAFQRTNAVSSKPVQYALMVQRGDLARSGIAVGDFIYVPVDAPTE